MADFPDTTNTLSSTLTRRTALMGLAATSCGSLMPVQAIAAPSFEEAAEASLQYLEERGYFVVVNPKGYPPYFSLGVLGVDDPHSAEDNAHVELLYKAFQGDESYPRLVDHMNHTGRIWPQ